MLPVLLALFTPQMEMEIQTCPTCLVCSLDGARLFVDMAGTKNFYDGVFFSERDIGTNGKGYWYRPSTDEEGGQLEVGVFSFHLPGKSSFRLDFLDVESKGSFFLADGERTDLPTGPDGNLLTYTLKNVSSLTISAGVNFVKGTGDGVLFRISQIPEPSTVFSLGAVGALLLSLKRKRAT